MHGTHSWSHGVGRDAGQPQSLAHCQDSSDSASRCGEIQLIKRAVRSPFGRSWASMQSHLQRLRCWQALHGHQSLRSLSLRLPPQGCPPQSCGPPHPPPCVHHLHLRLAGLLGLLPHSGQVQQWHELEHLQVEQYSAGESVCTSQHESDL